MFAGLGKIHGRLEVLNHKWRPNVFPSFGKTFGGLRPKTTKGGQMIFEGLGKIIWGA